MLGAHALARGDADGALREAEAARRGRPQDPLGWTLEGEVLWRVSRLEDAASAFGRALALDPGNAQALIGLGRTELARGDSARAGDAWRRAIGRTRNAQALSEMVSFFVRRGSPADAEAARAALRALEGGPR